MATNPGCLEAEAHPLDDESRQLRESGALEAVAARLVQQEPRTSAAMRDSCRP